MSIIKDFSLFMGLHRAIGGNWASIGLRPQRTFSDKRISILLDVKLNGSGSQIEKNLNSTGFHYGFGVSVKKMELNIEKGHSFFSRKENFKIKGSPEYLAIKANFPLPLTNGRICFVQLIDSANAKTMRYVNGMILHPIQRTIFGTQPKLEVVFGGDVDKLGSLLLGKSAKLLDLKELDLKENVLIETVQEELENLDVEMSQKFRDLVYRLRHADKMTSSTSILGEGESRDSNPQSDQTAPSGNPITSVAEISNNTKNSHPFQPSSVSWKFNHKPRNAHGFASTRLNQLTNKISELNISSEKISLEPKSNLSILCENLEIGLKSGFSQLKETVVTVVAWESLPANVILGLVSLISNDLLLDLRNKSSTGEKTNFSSKTFIDTALITTSFFNGSMYACTLSGLNVTFNLMTRRPFNQRAFLLKSNTYVKPITILGNAIQNFAKKSRLGLLTIPISLIGKFTSEKLVPSFLLLFFVRNLCKSMVNLAFSNPQQKITLVVGVMVMRTAANSLHIAWLAASKEEKEEKNF